MPNLAEAAQIVGTGFNTRLRALLDDDVSDIYDGHKVVLKDHAIKRIPVFYPPVRGGGGGRRSTG